MQRPENWEQETMGALFECILNRMIVTYMLNELVKTGVKRPMKTGIMEHLKQRQAQYNHQIVQIMREIDRQ